MEPRFLYEIVHGTTSVVNQNTMHDTKYIINTTQLLFIQGDKAKCEMTEQLATVEQV